MSVTSSKSSTRTNPISRKQPGSRCSSNMTRIEKHTRSAMKVNGKSLSIKLITIRPSKCKNKTKRGSTTRASSMDSKPKTPKLLLIKRTCKKKSYLPLTLSKLSKSSATRPNSNLWTCSKP